MKIAILLPYKENFSNYNAGAVSIFVNSLNKHSHFKKWGGESPGGLPPVFREILLWGYW